MSALADLAGADLLRAQRGADVIPPEAARDVTARIAWALFTAFQDRTFRVRLFWGLTWTVKLRELRPLWASLFGLPPEGAV